jgi:SnoaL-like domain
MNNVLGAFLGGLILAGTVGAATAERYASNYARDRAEIEDLQARYLFALDWQDPELYASTFSEDGVLIWAAGTARGRAAIVKDMQQAREVDARDRRPYLGAYGHYEDELRRINGQWLFTKRQIFNEQRDGMAASDQNPAW